ncbi:MAG TPA: ATP-binding protein [Thermoanaerobaculia bacterium]|nr:ATP-binding protein [Thermoanaerobaculia bacterium]
MSLRDRLYQQGKNTRTLLFGLAGLLFVFTAIFYLLQRDREMPAYLVTNRVLLFVLWYVNVVLILAILFVLLRDLFKLFLERRHRILGSKLKTKLVATYVGLSLFPVLTLFVIATELLQGSIDRWFATPVRPVLEQGNAVAQALIDRIQTSCASAARRALVDLGTADLSREAERERLAGRLQKMLAENDLDFLAVYEGTDFVQGVVDSRSGISDLPEPGRDLLGEAATEGRAVRTVEPPGGRGRLVLAAVSGGAAAETEATDPGTAGPGGKVEAGKPEAAEKDPLAPDPAEPKPRIVVAGSLLDPVLAERTERLIEAFQSYRQLEVQKEDLRASHLLIFLMVTLLILLASTWTGLYLARRVTVPILALAEGTRRISDGDLDHRVEVPADDELGVLVASFNRMTEELQRSNRALQTTNERLAEERALVAAVLENVAAGIISIDGAGRIFTCNGAALQMLHQREDEVVGRTAAEAWSDPERSKLAALLASLPEPQTGRDRRSAREVQMVVGGDWKTFEVKVTPIRDAAGSRGRVLVLEDLTELIQAQQLAAWNEAARRVAHEIKNPLTPIRLGAERLLEKHRRGDPELGPAIEEAADIIVREVENLQGMVDEFSRYARMPRPRPAQLELARLIEETCHLYRDVKVGVPVVCELGREPLPAVWLDGEQIRRALINLIDNGVEATDPPGQVTVSVETTEGHLEIHVADTGRGIPSESKDKLFLPYFSTKGRGTGMGLAIVHRIVTDHHGTLRVEDNRPNGTVFTIELPLG